MNSVSFRGIFACGLTLLLVACCYAEGSHNVAVILVKDSNENRFDVERIMPAIDLAADKCKKDFNVTLNLLEGFYMNQCSESEAIGKATSLGKENDLTAFVGPACSKDLQSVGPYARYLNIPILTGLGDVLKDRKSYSTLIRVSYDLKDKARAIVRFLSHEDWRYFGMVYRKGDVFYDTLAEEIRNILSTDKKFNMTITCERTYERAKNKTVLSDLEVLVKDMKMCARIIVILGGEKEVREMLLIAQELEMIDSGEYIFLYPELYQNEARGNESWAGGPEPAEVKEKLKKAFQSLFIVTLHQPLFETFNEFSQQVKNIALEKYQYVYNQSVNYFTASFHDAVLMLCDAIHKTEKEGLDSHNGTILMDKLTNSNGSFQGVSGTVTINENGDRVANYAILDQTDVDSGNFDTVLTYYGAKNQFTEDNNAVIRWHGRQGSVKPVDRPRCGFDGKDPVCAKEDFPLLETIFGTLVVLVLLAILVGFLIYRKMSTESALNNMSWKVRWEEIVFNKNFRTSWMMSRMSISSAISSKMEKGWVSWSPESAQPRDADAQDPNGRLSDQQQQLQYVMTGVYKGNTVAVKKLHKQKRVDLTRTVLVELKQMREAQHENISRFIGACVDPPNISVLTDYCPKGSLYDVIHNDTLNLDWMFRYSLINDIVKGICFLHSNEIGTHGRLRSTNCLVDSHFVLKLADFGLPSLRQEEVFCDIDFADHKKFLWKAPELLRLTKCPSKGTQKGDVYSFGIILQEIVLREEPFYPHLEFLDVSDVIRRVRKREEPPFRPVVEKDTCIRELRNLMHKCWAEEPSYRPDCNQIKSEMRTINRGQRGETNLMDNMLSRMEQYANNLEQLVELRTAAFLEEKRKSEELLYQVLPRSVAEQLKRGKHVVPELYDSVTIYFSDLVGFTSMCSTSTPIQVVAFLNGLYTCFDSIASDFDVYKVETIGDAYMVVSGLPDRNGLSHAREIARMALCLLGAVGSMSVQHRPNEKIRLRIGIHTGPCCAGVVGQKMPRYCLFGDTVNTASRMESTGEPLKIHVSDSTKKALDNFGSFVLEPRGEVDVKGKGRMNTYWLVQENVPGSRPRQGTGRGK